MKRNNILIAEFMGLKTLTRKEAEGKWEILNVNEVSILEHQRYHLSWDWLMPVVEKIESISDTELTCMTTEIKEYQFQIYLSNTCLRDTNKLELIYQAVLEFIEWYNQTQQYTK